MMRHRVQVEAYFRAEEQGDVQRIVNLCSPEVVIRNAAQPPAIGKEGAARYVEDFKGRTSERSFTILAYAENEEVAFAWWDAAITFNAGVAFGPLTTQRPFSVALRGICRFRFDEGGLFTELDVCHETTTPTRLAQEAAR